MVSEHLSLGARGESLARKYLERLGWKIIGQNVRVGRHKEIDLLAYEGKTLVFVEVKARTSDEFGTPEEAVTVKKLARLQKAVALYIQQHRDVRNVRLDVIGILFPQVPGERAKLKHLRAVGGGNPPVF